MPKDKIKFDFLIPGIKTKAAEPESKFLGTVTGLAATSDIDRENELIAEKALVDGAKSLSVNTTVFLNHEWNGKPVGKVLSSKFVKNGNQSGIEVTVGISKTAADIWTLIEEGILNKFSIGGFLVDYEFKELDSGKNVGIIKEMDIMEVSVVGVPANPNAEFVASAAKMLKSLKPEKVKNMDEDKQTEVKNESSEKLDALSKNVSELTNNFSKFIDVFSKSLEKKVEPEVPVVEPKPADPVAKRVTPMVEDPEPIVEKIYGSKEDELRDHKKELNKLLSKPEDMVIILQGSLND